MRAAALLENGHYHRHFLHLFANWASALILLGCSISLPLSSSSCKIELLPFLFFLFQPPMGLLPVAHNLKLRTVRTVFLTSALPS
eukprot:m.223431 g.223431  ORF g.223431 m.223431 type:complete len:85 (+) comp10825_c0_seq1:1382-1636(+)